MIYFLLALACVVLQIYIVRNIVRKDEEELDKLRISILKVKLSQEKIETRLVDLDQKRKKDMDYHQKMYEKILTRGKE